MNCERVRPFLTAFAAGETPEHTTQWVAAHVGSCNECTRAAERHRSIRTALRAAGETEVDPPPWLASAVAKQIREPERTRVMPMIPLPAAEIVRVVQENREAIMGVAGTTAVAAGVAWLAWRALKSRRPGQTPSPAS